MKDLNSTYYEIKNTLTDLQKPFLLIKSAPSDNVFELSHDGNALLALKNAIQNVDPDVVLVQLQYDDFEKKGVFTDYPHLIDEYVRLNPEQESNIESLKTKTSTDLGCIKVIISKNGLNLELCLKTDWFEVWIDLLIFLNDLIDDE